MADMNVLDHREVESEKTRMSRTFSVLKNQMVGLEDEKCARQ
jgi:hypothetical protein